MMDKVYEPVTLNMTTILKLHFTFFALKDKIM